MINKFILRIKSASFVTGKHDASLWALCAVSFLWSLSSLMVFSVLPSFLTEELDLSHRRLGYMEGGALFLSFIAKVFAGVLSDYLRKRKPLIMLGSFLTALSKPLFALAGGPYMAFFARFSDRFSKGLRSAPTDALLADLGSQADYGAVYGLRQSVYTSGAICGALFATVFMYFFGHQYRLIFCLATIPAVAAMYILHVYVANDPLQASRAEGACEKPVNSCEGKQRSWNFLDLQALPRSFWMLMLVLAFLMLARFSEAFITLRVKELGVSTMLLPMVLVVMDIVHAAISFPLGRFADRISKANLLILGMLIQFFASGLMALANSWQAAFAAVILVGVYMGVTQGVMRAFIACVVPLHMRGTAFAVFYLVCGVAVLVGNSVAGLLSENFGLFAVFCGGSVFTAMAVLVFVATESKKPKELVFSKSISQTKLVGKVL